MLEAVYSTIAAGAIGSAVAEHYALGPATDCLLFSRGFNDTYAFTGADGARYMARLCDHRFRGPPNVDYETALLAHLTAQGVLVGAPVAARDGRLWRDLDAPEGPRAFAVFRRLQGIMPGYGLLGPNPSEGGLGELAAFGAGFARLHAAAESYAGPPSLYQLDAGLLLERPLELVLAAPAIDPETRDGFAALGADLRNELATLAPTLTRVHCHGDNHGGNTLVSTGEDGARVCGWYDFDDGGPGFLAYDLAVFLWSLRRNMQGRDAEARTEAAWRAYIGGYRSAGPLPEADFAAIGLCVVVRQINFDGQYASRLEQWGAGMISADFFKRELTLARGWRDLPTPPA